MNRPVIALPQQTVQSEPFFLCFYASILATKQQWFDLGAINEKKDIALWQIIRRMMTLKFRPVHVCSMHMLPHIENVLTFICLSFRTKISGH